MRFYKIPRSAAKWGEEEDKKCINEIRNIRGEEFMGVLGPVQKVCPGPHGISAQKGAWWGYKGLSGATSGGLPGQVKHQMDALDLN